MLDLEQNVPYNIYIKTKKGAKMKKLKLFLSLCMMCLCIAVLCIGILAASSATYNINGNISYNMIDGVALVNTRVYKVAGTESDLSTKCTELSSKSFEEIERDTSTYYILSQKLDSEPLVNTSNETSSSSTTSVNIVYGAVESGVEYYTYYIVIEIKYVSTDTGYVLNAYLSTLGTSTISNLASNANGESNKIEIASGEFYNIVIGLSYTGTTTTEKFNYTLNMSYNELTGFNKLLTTYADANEANYWGVPFGKVASGSKTPVIWRYVGDYSTSSGGTETFTRYESYTNKKPKLVSGSVFVQETSLTNNSVEWGSTYTCNNYFTECTIRASIREGGLFSLDYDEELIKKSYIQSRTLPDIEWFELNYDKGRYVFPYQYRDNLKLSNGNNDYFWLMDVREISLYFNDPLQEDTEAEYDYQHKNIVWGKSDSGVSFWLRTPSVYYNSGGYEGDYLCSVNDKGVFWWCCANNKMGVRAAFRLA